jgi:N-acetyl sugar amidotransferase
MSTRPNIIFSPEGLCLPCVQYVEPSTVDWELRLRELTEIVDFGRRNSSSGYECIVGVSGGKDSTRQALYVRDYLKMRPLLVCLTYPPDQISQIGVSNLSNLINLGFDCVSVSCSPKIWKELMRVGFYKYGNWAKSTEMALFSSVPRLAIAYQIPLIWWGENISTMMGDSKAYGGSPSDGNRVKYSNTLDGGRIDWMLAHGFSHTQLMQYHFPSDDEIQRANLRTVFLAYFWSDFSSFTNGNFSSLRGLTIKTPTPSDADFWGTSMLDENFFTVNMMIKWLKFGFGRANDNVNEEIRAGRMTRDHAIKLVEKFDGKCPKEAIEQFCDFLSITVEEFWNVVDKFVNRDLFDKVSQGEYQKKFKVGTNFE